MKDKSKEMIFNGIQSMFELAWEEAKAEGKQEALESGVVGEMVELVKYIVKEQDEPDEEVTVDYIICGAESILSKLEAK